MKEVFRLVVRVEQYESDKQEFFMAHKNDFHLSRHGNSAEDYQKVYSFSDGSTWYESMTRETVEELVYFETCKCNIKVRIDVMKVEYWSTDDSKSKCYYEQWNTL